MSSPINIIPPTLLSYRLAPIISNSYHSYETYSISQYQSYCLILQDIAQIATLTALPDDFICLLYPTCNYDVNQAITLCKSRGLIRLATQFNTTNWTSHIKRLSPTKFITFWNEYLQCLPLGRHPLYHPIMNETTLSSLSSPPPIPLCVESETNTLCCLICSDEFPYECNQHSNNDSTITYNTIQSTSITIPSYLFAPCGDVFCTNCWFQYCAVNITNRNIIIPCINDSCRASLPRSFIQTVLFYGDIIQSATTTNPIQSSPAFPTAFFPAPYVSTDIIQSSTPYSLTQSSIHANTIPTFPSPLQSIVTTSKQSITSSSSSSTTWFIDHNNNDDDDDDENNPDQNLNPKFFLNMLTSLPHHQFQLIDPSNPYLVTYNPSNITIPNLSNSADPAPLTHLLSAYDQLFLPIIAQQLSHTFTRCICPRIHLISPPSLPSLTTFNNSSCTHCLHSICTRCSQPQHAPLSCLLLAMWNVYWNQSSADQVWMLHNSRRCPKCNAFIEKNRGCNHISCPCGHHFCWVCNGDWSTHIEANKNRPIDAYKCVSRQSNLQQNLQLNTKSVTMFGTTTTTTQSSSSSSSSAIPSSDKSTALTPTASPNGDSTVQNDVPESSGTNPPPHPDHTTISILHQDDTNIPTVQLAIPVHPSNHNITTSPSSSSSSSSLLSLDTKLPRRALRGPGGFASDAPSIQWRTMQFNWQAETHRKSMRQLIPILDQTSRQFYLSTRQLDKQDSIIIYAHGILSLAYTTLSCANVWFVLQHYPNELLQVLKNVVETRRDTFLTYEQTVQHHIAINSLRNPPDDPNEITISEIDPHDVVEIVEDEKEYKRIVQYVHHHIEIALIQQYNEDFQKQQQMKSQDRSKQNEESINRSEPIRHPATRNGSEPIPTLHSLLPPIFAFRFQQLFETCQKLVSCCDSYVQYPLSPNNVSLRGDDNGQLTQMSSNSNSLMQANISHQQLSDIQTIALTTRDCAVRLAQLWGSSPLNPDFNTSS